MKFHERGPSVAMQHPTLQNKVQAHLSADMVQRILDENQQLILAVIENQQTNNTHECAQYLQNLQRNLMMLATIGDGQVNGAGGLLPPEHRFHEAQTPQWESAGGGAGAARPGAGGGMNLVGARRGDAGFDGDAAMLPGHGGSLGGGMRGYRENGAVHCGGGKHGAARGGVADVGEMRSGAHTDIGASSGMQLVNAGVGGAGWGGGGIGGGGQVSVGGSAGAAFWSEKEKEALFRAVSHFGFNDFNRLSQEVGTRTASDCQAFLANEILKMDMNQQQRRARLQNELQLHGR